MVPLMFSIEGALSNLVICRGLQAHSLGEERWEGGDCDDYCCCGMHAGNTGHELQLHPPPPNKDILCPCHHSS